jgi:hypothetical protein
MENRLRNIADRLEGSQPQALVAEGAVVENSIMNTADFVFSVIERIDRQIVRIDRNL